MASYKVQQHVEISKLFFGNERLVKNINRTIKRIVERFLPSGSLENKRTDRYY